MAAAPGWDCNSPHAVVEYMIHKKTTRCNRHAEHAGLGENEHLDLWDSDR